MIKKYLLELKATKSFFIIVISIFIFALPLSTIYFYNSYGINGSLNTVVETSQFLICLTTILLMSLFKKIYIDNFGKEVFFSIGVIKNKNFISSLFFIITIIIFALPLFITIAILYPANCLLVFRLAIQILFFSSLVETIDHIFMSTLSGLMFGILTLLGYLILNMNNINNHPVTNMCNLLYYTSPQDSNHFTLTMYFFLSILLLAISQILIKHKQIT